MLDRDKLNDYLIPMCEDTDSELDRFIKGLLILIEFGNFDADEENEGQEGYKRMEDYQTRQIGRILASLIEAMGMQAENMQRASLGESMAYSDIDFHNIAEEIKHLTNESR